MSMTLGRGVAVVGVRGPMAAAPGARVVGSVPLGFQGCQMRVPWPASSCLRNQGAALIIEALP
jgi:hypothetical protein